MENSKNTNKLSFTILKYFSIKNKLVLFQNNLIDLKTISIHALFYCKIREKFKLKKNGKTIICRNSPGGKAEIFLYLR